MRQLDAGYPGSNQSSLWWQFMKANCAYWFMKTVSGDRLFRFRRQFMKAKWPECNVDPIYKTKMNPAFFYFIFAVIFWSYYRLQWVMTFKAKNFDSKRIHCIDHAPFFVPDFLEVSLSDTGWAVCTLPPVTEIERYHCIWNLHVVNNSIILTSAQLRFFQSQVTDFKRTFTSETF